ncbi:hypothetical protein BC831DRAFT_395861 [Entophlyctis helioformis]|nr:hypothetical protein BC831DRAFT_395861 [Entophlyctis helioformis]
MAAVAAAGAAAPEAAAKIGRAGSETPANPLFVQWLSESAGVAHAAVVGNGQLRQHPQRLWSGTEASKVKYVGPKIAERLERRLQKHIQSNPQAAADWQRPQTQSQAAAVDQDLDRSVCASRPSAHSAPAASVAHASPRQPPKRAYAKSAAERVYVPRYRSGAYAILLALHLHAPVSNFMSKHEIITAGEAYSDSSFTIPNANKGANHTAWSSMSTLVAKDLVFRTGMPHRFTLTEEGRDLARQLAELARTLQASAASHPNTASLELASETSDDAYSELDEYSGYGIPGMGMQAHGGQALAGGSATRDALSGALGAFLLEPQGSSQRTTFIPRTIPAVALPTGSRVPSQPGDNGQPACPGAAPHMPREPNTPHLGSRTAPANAANMNARLVCMQAGTFDIHLLLDSREIVRGTNRQFFQKELEQLKVSVITRALPLGDVMWIAKRKPGSSGVYQQSGLGLHHDDEIALDFIIERKLLDDLVASIKDDRFKEQKFRLGSCGMSNLIYLIEEVSTADAEGFGMDKIMTAITQTQILDGFFLKHTYSPNETVTYLHNLTCAIQSMYRTQDLYALRAADVTKESLPDLRRACEHELRMRSHSSAAGQSHGKQSILLTYEAFSGINGKSNGFTLGDIWLRQLMCIRGVSSEKALAIAAKYPTSRALLQALAEARDQASKETLLRSIGEGRRGVGLSLARSIITLLEADAY